MSATETRLIKRIREDDRLLLFAEALMEENNLSDAMARMKAGESPESIAARYGVTLEEEKTI